MADAVCVPSRNEPFGIVVLEAWAAGKPVLATVNGGPNEFVWHETNGLKIYPNPDSIAWGIETLFKNFERARWMGGNGRYAVDVAFTWNRIATQVEALYDELCGRSAKPADTERESGKAQIVTTPPTSAPVQHRAPRQYHASDERRGDDAASAFNLGVARRKSRAPALLTAV